MSINPALKLKLDELFLRWLTDPATQKVLHQNLIQLKANEPLQAMLAVPSGVVVGPMSSSVYSFFYGSCRPESPGPNTEGSVNGVTTTSGAVGSLTSPRPNTPPYFPQPPHSKIFSPRSPRRHVPAANGVQSNPVSKVYQTCSVDLTWQRAVHSCQRCPRAVLTANAVAIPPITQSNIERTVSRFCPAGVHMSHCVPASELFAAPTKSLNSKLQQSGAGGAVDGVNAGLTLPFWGPPNLPTPTVSPLHPVHAAHLARSSYPSSVLNSFESSEPKSSAAVHHFHPVQRSKLLPKSPESSETPHTTAVSKPQEERESVTKTSSPEVNSTELAKTNQPEAPLSESPQVSKPEQDKISVPSTVSPPDEVPNVPKEANDTTKVVIPAPEKGAEVLGDGFTASVKEAPASDTSAVPEEPIPEEGSAKADTTVSSPNSKEQSEIEGAGEARTVDGSVPKKPKKDEPVAPAARAKAATEVESESVGPGRPTVRGPPGHEEEVDRGKSGKSPARPSAERTVGKQGQQGPSPVPSATPAPEAAKSDTGAAQNLDSSSSITPTPKEAREPARHRTHPAQQQTGITSGGGLGDVSPSPSKPNGVLNRPSPTESHPAPVPKSSAQISSALTRKPIPSFYFPLGQTRMTAEEIGFEMDRAKRELMKLAEPASGNKNGTETMFAHANIGRVAKALNCPFYWKYAIYSACGGTNEHQPISLSAILKTWGQVLHACPDETARFVYLLTKGKATCLVQSDFNPLIQDILESHPGLAFLQAAKDFHSRYVATVVSRIFFNVNTSWSGRISLGELRKSNFLGVLASLEDEEDINLVTQYFSYEHFYVIYCKFWELDEDHDLIISRADLARHNNYAISERMIDRIFSGTVTRGTAFKEGVMTYPDFVWFLLAEEDKRHPRSIEYWFRCMDVDGDGLLSMYELEYFYSEQVARMEEMGIEPISFEDCLCQCLDMVKPALGDKIRLADLKQCRLCNIFFDTFFNLPKYLQHEQRDPFSNLRDIEEGLNELSDWDRYAAEAYEMLVAVEGGNQEDGVDEEEGDDEEVDEEPDAESPVPGSNDKADAAARKDTNTKTNTTNTKIDSNNTDHGTMNTTVGAGESVESSSPETGKKGKRKRGSTPTVNGTA